MAENQASQTSYEGLLENGVSHTLKKLRCMLQKLKTGYVICRVANETFLCFSLLIVLLDDLVVVVI